MIPSAAFPDAQALNGKMACVWREKIACVRREKVDGFGPAADAFRERERLPGKLVASRRFSLEREFLAPELGASG